MNQSPVVSRAVVEWLERLFPNGCPDIADSNRQIWMNAGRQALIKKLRREMETQLEHSIKAP